MLDQTAKGAFFDIMDVYHVDLQSQLHVNARTYWLFAAFVSAWRLIITGGFAWMIFYAGRRLLTELRKPVLDRSSRPG
jgi:hypothetical protein